MKEMLINCDFIVVKIKLSVPFARKRNSIKIIISEHGF